MKGVWYRPAKIVREEDWVNCVPENIVLGNEIYNEYTRKIVVGTMPCGVPTYAVSIVGKGSKDLGGRIWQGTNNQMKEDFRFNRDGYFLPIYVQKNSSEGYVPTCYVSGAEEIGNVNLYPMYRVQAYQQITVNPKYPNIEYGGIFYIPSVGNVGLNPGGIKTGVTINGVKGKTDPAYPIGAIAVYSYGSDWPQIRYNNEGPFVPSFSAGPVGKHIRFGVSIATPLTISFVVHSTLSTLPEPVLSKGILHTDRAFNGQYGVYHFELSSSEWTYVTWSVEKSTQNNTYIEIYADRMTNK